MSNGRCTNTDMVFEFAALASTPEDHTNKPAEKRLDLGSKNELTH